MPLNITVGDGGEDGRIECGGIDRDGEFIVKGTLLLQVKATDMSPAKCTAEMLNKNAPNKGVLKAR